MVDCNCIQHYRRWSSALAFYNSHQSLRGLPRTPSTTSPPNSAPDSASANWLWEVPRTECLWLYVLFVTYAFFCTWCFVTCAFGCTCCFVTCGYVRSFFVGTPLYNLIVLLSQPYCAALAWDVFIEFHSSFTIAECAHCVVLLARTVRTLTRTVTALYC